MWSRTMTRMPGMAGVVLVSSPYTGMKPYWPGVSTTKQPTTSPRGFSAVTTVPVGAGRPLMVSWPKGWLSSSVTAAWSSPS